jgi:two-component system, OmpR family, sensor histidine kinase KdpD
VTPRLAPSPLLLKAQRPSALKGVLVAIAGVALATAVIYPLKHLAPAVSLGFVYLLAVVAVSTFWGLTLGVATGVASAAAFNFFHLRPVGFFTLSDGRDWVALSAFVAVAVATGMVGELARTRTREADERRQEADLAATLAQLLLGAPRLDDALPQTSHKLAGALGLRTASIALGSVEPGERQAAFALAQEDERVGTLLVPSELSSAERARIGERIVPALASILAAAQHRAQLQAEVVETDALRRSDEMKTAILRSVSHDLRTPVTAILTAGAALDPMHPSVENVAEVRELVVASAMRLSRLIDKLLDLSLLQAGHSEPRREWFSIEEVLQEAIEQARDDDESVRLSVDAQVPLLHGDSSQLERAFANLIENALHHCAGKPVLVRARAVGSRVRVRVVDQGPGIPAAEQHLIFLPFYRSEEDEGSHQGSGLGLAIAKGFVEAAEGNISVESSSHGTSIVVELPISPTGGPPDTTAALAGAEAPR